ncbi:MAG TPA: cytochrome c [Rhodocyclaceae bacterium]
MKLTQMKWLSAVAALVVAGSAGAESSKFEEQIKYRRAVMTMIKWHGEKISPLVKTPQAFNRDEVLRNATYLEMLSKLAQEGFVPGSHEGDTKAKAEIWKDWNRFKALGDKFEAEAVKLRETAKSGDSAAIKAQLGAVNKVCKSCHDDFKASAL